MAEKFNDFFTTVGLAQKSDEVEVVKKELKSKIASGVMETTFGLKNIALTTPS